MKTIRTLALIALMGGTYSTWAEEDDVFADLMGETQSSTGVLEKIETPAAKSRPQTPLKKKALRRAPLVKKSTATLPLTTIRTIDFSPVEKGSRMTLITDRRPQYQISENIPSRELVLILNRAVVAKKLQREYDTEELQSPVRNFTVKSGQRGSDPNVQIVLRLSSLLRPEVRASETGLTLSFPKVAERKVASSEKSQVTVDDGATTIEGYTGKPIQLEIQNSDIHDVLRLIAKTSGYDVVIGDDVQGRVGTLSFNNVPWDQALSMVLQMKKLGYVKQGKVIRVATLTSLKAEAEEAAAQEASQAKAEPLKTVLIPISYAKSSELAPRAKAFLTARGSVDTDERSNTIIVRDVEKVVERVKKLFTVLDTQPPLVSVSAKIVEMKTEFSRTIGMSLMQLSGKMNGLNFGAGSSAATGAGFDMSGPPLNTSINIRAANFADLNARLSLAEFDNQLKILANPTITVQQNQKGTISQGVTSYYQTGTVTAGGNAVPSLTPVAATLALNVTPIVASDGSISMTVDVKNEIPSTDGKSATSIDTRTVSTQVLMQSGDTAVVGGIFNNRSSEKASGVPFLRKIPIVGTLFSHQQTTDDRNEVLIFLTAKLLNPDESFKRNL